MDLGEARSLALALRNLLNQAHRLIDESLPPSDLVTRVTQHVGCALGDLICVSQRFKVWEHANLQRGTDAFLAGRGGWFGVAGPGREHTDLMGILTSAERGMEHFGIGAVDFLNIAVGPDETADVVNFGLVCTEGPDGSPVVVALRGPSAIFHRDDCSLDVVAATREAATAARQEIERLMREHDVFRGQILTFGVSEHRGNSLVTFLPRPSMEAAEVVLPEGVLETIERHVVGIAQHTEALLARGQHLKRGLLLHGPPGTGKTHTVRYLMGRMPGVTVLVMTGTAMRFIADAAALARRLQPAIVVVEDVDLVAHDRRMSDEGSPLLFTLFDAMDGIGADADVTFVLTTNWVESLEQALADRPGRVDLAVQVPRPDARCRLALLRLYGRELDLQGLDDIVARTDGMTASFFKELIRRSVLLSLREDRPMGDLAPALEEMLRDREALTRSMLGSGTVTGSGDGSRTAVQEHP